MCKTLENTEESIKNGKSRETDNIGYTRRRKTNQKQKHNTIYVGHQFTQTNTINVNKTCVLLQTTGGKDEPNNVLCGNRNEHHNIEPRTYRHVIGQHKKLKRWATRTPPKKRGWTQVLTKGNTNIGYLVYFSHREKWKAKYMVVIRNFECVLTDF